jgi:hypothetical protein
VSGKWIVRMRATVTYSREYDVDLHSGAYEGLKPREAAEADRDAVDPAWITRAVDPAWITRGVPSVAVEVVSFGEAHK